MTTWTNIYNNVIINKYTRTVFKSLWWGQVSSPFTQTARQSLFSPHSFRAPHSFRWIWTFRPITNQTQDEPHWVTHSFVTINTKTSYSSLSHIYYFNIICIVLSNLPSLFGLSICCLILISKLNQASSCPCVEVSLGKTPSCSGWSGQHPAWWLTASVVRVCVFMWKSSEKKKPCKALWIKVLYKRSNLYKCKNPCSHY